MKKILIGLSGLVVALIAAVLIVPGLIDWNDYKAEISSRAKDATGRSLVIDGDIKLTVLPAPALIASNVRLSNIDGATAPDMVRLKSLQVQVALGPLLSGQIQVQTVRLVEPVIELEKLADGRVNWTLGETVKQTSKTPRVAGDELTAGSGSEPKKATSETGPDIILDSFVIENGTLIYRDAGTTNVERIENINANVAAASINGPFESDGDLTLRGMPLQYDITVGKIIEGRTAPLSLSINIAPGATHATVSGAVVGLDGAPKFKGKMTVKGEVLSDLIAGVAPVGDLPGLLGQGFEVVADVTAGATEAELTEFSIGLGTVTATGNAAIDLGKIVNVNIDLAADSIDADKLLALPSIARAPSPETSTPDAKPATAVVPKNAPAVAAGNKSAPKGGFALPANINVGVRLSAKSISLKGGLIREAQLGVELANGEITISQASAQLPGSADVAVFGFVVPVDGAPQFDGNLEVSVGDLRGVLDWLDVSPPPVPADRLRKLTLASNLKATPKEAILGNIDLQFDSSRLTGSTRLGLTGSMPINANLLLDRLNLDAYLGSAKAANAVASNNSVPSGASTPPPPSGNKTNKAAGDPLAVLASLNVLKTLDARIKAQVNTLVYKGAPIKDIILDGKISDNILSLDNFSVAQMAGAKIKAGGTVSDLVGVPSLKNVTLNVATGDLARLLRMGGVKAPMDSRKIGAMSLQARADGSLLRPVIDATIKGAGGSLAVKGKVSLLPVFDGFDGSVNLKHTDMAALVRALGVAYRPAGELGAVDFSTALKARATGLDLSGIKARLGPVDMTGTANVALNGPRPKLTAVLKTGEIVADKFLPATGKATLTGFLPAAYNGSPSAPLTDPAFRRMAALSSGRWSTEPLDFSALKSFDADVKLLSDAFVYGAYRIVDADLAATVNSGVLLVEQFKGGLFGGTIDARGTLSAANPSSFNSSVSLGNLNVADALVAVTGKKLATGDGAMELRLSSAGYTLSDMIAALSGNGSIAMKQLDVKSGAAGTPMAAAFGLISGLNDLGGVLSGKKASSSLADITGTFTIDKGVARSSDLALNSSMGNGRASGSADLARWMVDMNGEVTVAQSFLGQVLSSGNQAAQRLPFSVSGRLDSPNVKLDTSKLQAAGMIPGLDKVLGKSKVGSVLQQIIPGLGGGSTQTKQPSQPPSQPPAPGDTPPPPPPSAEPQKIKPEDVLKGLLKGFGR